MTDQERKDAIRFFEWVAEDEAMNYSRLAIEALKAQELNKSDVTHEALCAVAQYLLFDGKEFRFQYKNTWYVMRIEELEGGEQDG